jgi:ribonuclease P protein component
MRGEQYLTKPEQFKLVFDKGTSLAEKSLVVRCLSNGLNITRFGFSVSSRVGGAVVRNRVKRRLREIARKAPMKSGWDIVVIARPTAAGADFKALDQMLARLLTRAHVLGINRDAEAVK